MSYDIISSSVFLNSWSLIQKYFDSALDAEHGCLGFNSILVDLQCTRQFQATIILYLTMNQEMFVTKSVRYLSIFIYLLIYLFIYCCDKTHY